MPVFSAFSKRLSMRIWLAMVLVSLVLLVIGSSMVWHMRPVQGEMHHPRVVLDEQDKEVGSAEFVHKDDGLPQILITLNTGQQLSIPSRARPVTLMPHEVGGSPPPRFGPDGSGPPRGRMERLPAPPWWKASSALIIGLAAVGLVFSFGIYPLVRRMTQRLESLQQSVQRWGEGDLSVRVPVRGQDEVADLAIHFNAAAERIEQLLASQQQLLSAQKSLLANASHELRSPLARIRMGLELLGGQPPSPSLRKELRQNINELDQLIDEILLASRLDAREADLGTIESIDLVGLTAEETSRIGAELDLQAEPDQLQVPGVAKLLRRLVRNLLENARRYGHPASGGASDTPDITLRLSCPPADADAPAGWVELRVLDRGPGVPPGLRERIFEPFYRLPGASEREGGVGLGLALVKSIALRHGGQVRCEGREGGGACFVVRLPRAAAA